MTSAVGICPSLSVENVTMQASQPTALPMVNRNYLEPVLAMEENDDCMDMAASVALQTDLSTGRASNPKSENIESSQSIPLKRPADDCGEEVSGHDLSYQATVFDESTPRRSKRARISSSTHEVKETLLSSASPNLANVTNGLGTKTSIQARRSDRKRAEKEEHIKELEACKPPYAAITTEEKQTWKGWCEIDSEPAFFNVMVKDLGVNGVKVQEVFSLEPEFLAMLPQPVYGLIFLFQYVNEEEDEEEQEPCPDHVWFANQVVTNACGSYALLNIINNVPEINLGKGLAEFKEVTMALSPAERGAAVADSEFIRRIHNSFARTVERQNLDACLEEDMKKAATKQKNKRNKKSKKIIEDEAAFHFIAYLPVQCMIWKMDGLDRQPRKLGPCGSDNWLDLIAPVLAARMADLETGQIEFNMLAVVRDPVVEHRANLAYNIKLLHAIEDRLTSINANWKALLSASNDGAHVSSASDPLGLTTTMIEESQLSAADEDNLIAKQRITHLLEWRDRTIKDQAPLHAIVRDEVQSLYEDESKASDRRNDYGSIIQAWLNMLAENEKLRGLTEGD